MQVFKQNTTITTTTTTSATIDRDQSGKFNWQISIDGVHFTGSQEMTLDKAHCEVSSSLLDIVRAK